MTVTARVTALFGSADWWARVVPVIAWLALGFAAPPESSSAAFALLALVLFGTVLAAVYHADIIAHRIGEPFGSLVLALAVTVIEVSLIVSIMVSDVSPAGSTLARDTVFATVMLASNGVLGLCLVVAGIRFGEPEVRLPAAMSYLAMLTVLAVSALVLPGYTRSAGGPIYTNGQLAFVAIVSLALYGVFLFIQTVRHRGYFLLSVTDNARSEPQGHSPSVAATVLAAAALPIALTAVVMLAKKLSPELEAAIHAAKIAQPDAVVGIIVAAIVLLPESLSAIRAAARNRLQTSINLALGSSLASIALTIPAVATVAIASGEPLILGLGATNEIMLAMTFIVATMTLGAGRATILQGAIHLFIFALFLFLAVVP